MKPVARVTVAWAVLGALLACAGPERAGTAAVRAAIDATWRQHIAAAVRKDLPAVLEIYAHDVIYLVSGTEVRGRAAIEAMEGSTLAQADVLDAVHSIDSLQVFGDVAYQIGTVVGPVRLRGQEPQTVTFHFMARWQRGADGRWRIACLVGS